jgi:probable rRNA maturation factor
MADPDPGSPTGVESLEVSVVTDDQQTEIAIDASRWAELATLVLRDERARGEMTLTFVERSEMSALNAEHMGADGPTDVLSFPLDDPDAEPLADEPVLLGDVVVCPAVAADAAPEHAGTLDDELALLVVHGCLHVLGHDHHDPDETRIMRARELELLVAHHWHGPAPVNFRQEQA